ncbi:16S rRNA (adenine(1518)-N(6)/adenine(1519)-N(6))-dimethyltransferase RsmA [Desulfovibrio aminophilus]|uniref:16S rRNA (adenine(1518)-N(6)/adenine(1519)-N(6))- dimethyltransferase RsmA n=1 Tax=Desulfovibrio aminophilus TaxID=81425 RepID=UPI00040054E2|nr:16S rRNA (adenine(1518)-N(6)/adenine(1519)-N(6))-dimethyltransferase RsmA [Desulfovibrio aminophilus]
MPFAKRSLGQNFLQDPNTARRIVAALEIATGDHVLEIGPGRGALTEWIIAAGPARFQALEKDRELARTLPDRWPSLEILAGDALEHRWESLDAPFYKIVGNLPYNIASPLIWDFVSRARNYGRAVFMVQYEVARRLTAEPGFGDYGALTAWVRNFAATSLLFKVGPAVFRPRPKVDSGVVLFSPLAKRPDPALAERLAKLLHGCFQKRRKQLANILKSQWEDGVGQWFAEQGLSGTLRPENLSPRHFLGLAERFGDHFFA